MDGSCVYSWLLFLKLNMNEYNEWISWITKGYSDNMGINMPYECLEQVVLELLPSLTKLYFFIFVVMVYMNAFIVDNNEDP